METAFFNRIGRQRLFRRALRFARGAHCAVLDARIPAGPAAVVRNSATEFVGDGRLLHRAGERPAWIELVGPYNARDYHQTTDEFDPRWTFAGTGQEATVAYELGRAIANDGSWPGWYPGIEYGAVRAASEAERAAK